MSLSSAGMGGVASGSSRSRARRRACSSGRVQGRKAEPRGGRSAEGGRSSGGAEKRAASLAEGSLRFFLGSSDALASLGVLAGAAAVTSLRLLAGSQETDRAIDGQCC